MDIHASSDMALLLKPAEKRKFMRPSLNLFQRKYFLFLAACSCMGFYLTYTSSISWTDRDGDGGTQSGKNYNRKDLQRSISAKSIVPTFQETRDYYYSPGEENGWRETTTDKMAQNQNWQNSEAGNVRSDKMACHIPRLQAFDPSVQRYDETPDPANCDKDYPLLFATDLESNLIQMKDPLKFGYKYCCYQKFKRGAGYNDQKIFLDRNCIRIKDSLTRIPDTTEFIMVSCEKGRKHGGNATLEPVDLFGFVHLKPSVEKRIQDFQQTRFGAEYSQRPGRNPKGVEEKPVSSGSEVRRKVNVVILGLDALSHMNFVRTMPLSHDYITKNLSAHGLSGYTKVGDNTFPNLVPALTGKTVEELENLCWKKDSKLSFDKCPFIWKNYASQGYRTAYGEDAVWMGIFNYQKRGFLKDPTDYYYNGFTSFLENKLGHNLLTNAQLCYGPRITFEISLDFLKKMAFTMDKTRRYFQFIWATSLFHDYLNEGKLGDRMLLETLQWFKNEGYFEDTVFILMSDHGIRWGPIRSTLQGRLEERMPFLYFIFPEWFKQQYQSAVSNLIRNEHRLTTPFDLYDTLQDLLNLKRVEDVRKNYKILDDGDLPRGISLFLPIPPRRTCQDAGIEDHWCVCRSVKSVNLEGNSLVQEAARSVVYQINGMFIKFPQCLPLLLNKVFNAQVLQSSNGNVEDDSENITDVQDPRLAKQEVTFTISFEVFPSGATFEATTTRRTNGLWEISGEISRTNIYGDQSICVSDYNLKKFCFCG